jgi:predicted nucleic acid-binding protein
MVLADTSVWIRYLANRAPYSSVLERLLGIENASDTSACMESCSWVISVVA